MVLPDHMIEALNFIKPMAPGNRIPGVISYGLTSYGYDARISDKNIKVFSEINAKEIDPKNFDPNALVAPIVYTTKQSEYFYIPPHGFALCETVEEFNIPREYLCIVLGKSTYARTGLIVNVTPGEPEWIGKWTIELSNTTNLPLRVYLNEGIMQCIFLKGEAVCRTSYADKKGKYQNQEGMTLPKIINEDAESKADYKIFEEAVQKIIEEKEPDQIKQLPKYKTVIIQSLSVRQTECLEFIIECIKVHNKHPTYGEIARHFNKSVSTVMCYISALIKKGYIKIPERKDRGIQILKTPEGNDYN